MRVEITETPSLKDTGAYLFEGEEHGAVPISFVLVDAAPGVGPDLHQHPYEEIFVVHDGEATFTVGEQSLLAVGGQIIVAPRNLPHKFINTGTGRLRMTNIHPSPRRILIPVLE